MLFCKIFFIRFVHLFSQIRCRYNFFTPQVCHKRCVYACSVFVNHTAAASNVVCSASHNSQQCQSWCKKKICNAVFGIPFADFRNNGKWRIVNNNAPLGIVFFFVIPSGIKRANNRWIAKFIFFQAPPFGYIVNIFWCVAIVRCFLRLELFKESLIVFVIV